MDRDADIDGDGIYEYRTLAGKRGLKNQGWKDSGQAILYADGSLVPDSIAVVEVQALFFAAKQAIAAVSALLGEAERAARLLDQAAALKARFNARFWMKDERFFALALDPDKALVKTIASNPGVCLACGIVDDDKARAVADHLMAPDMFSGWGVRTLSGRPSGVQSVCLSSRVGLAGVERACLSRLQALQLRRRLASHGEGDDRCDEPVRFRPASGSVRRRPSR